MSSETGAARRSIAEEQAVAMVVPASAQASDSGGTVLAVVDRWSVR